MAQFGAGSDLAAQCPTAPTPDGWRPWTDADGPIPDALTARAQAMLADATTALGATASFPIPGVTAMIRVEPHVWGRDAQGNLVQGCFRAAMIYLPTGTPAVAAVTPPSDGGSNIAKVVTALTAVSLIVGIATTLWGRK